MNRLEIRAFPPLEYAANEAMNTLATNLFYCGSDIRTIMITSRYAGEGKSFVAMNLMRTLAGLNRRVLLLDTDLRRSGIAGGYRLRFGVEKAWGLAHFLAGMCPAERIVYATNIDRAYMIPVGREVSSPLRLLSSPRMGQLMASLRERFDLVLVDTSPAGIIADAVEIAKYCDGALAVVGYNRGKKQEIGELRQTIEKTGCRVLGAVLNNVDFRSFSNRKHYYNSERYLSCFDSGDCSRQKTAGTRSRR